jgi:hypothetical protein
VQTFALEKNMQNLHFFLDVPKQLGYIMTTLINDLAVSQNLNRQGRAQE